MEEKLLESLLKRPGLEGKSELLSDMIQDSIAEMRVLLNYEETDPLPEGCLPAVKELVLIRFNRDGAEGISSEAFSSGGNVSYADALPERVRRIVRKYRKLPGG